jgi:hypothetical protein
MNTLILAVLLALTAGCATTGTLLTDPQQRTVLTACASSSAAIKALAAANRAGQLSADTQSAVLTAIGIIDPICGADDVPTLDAIQMLAFTKAVAVLSAHAARER